MTASQNNIPKLLRAIPDILDLAAETAGVFYEGKLQDKIVEQDPAWKPKSEATLKLEGEGKYKLWVYTGDLRSELSQPPPEKIPHKRGEFAMQVGVFSESRVIAAASLEYGTDRLNAAGEPYIEARPLFGPTFDRHLDGIVKVQKKKIEEQIGKYLF